MKASAQAFPALHCVAPGVGAGVDAGVAVGAGVSVVVGRGVGVAVGPGVAVRAAVGATVSVGVGAGVELLEPHAVRTVAITRRRLQRRRIGPHPDLLA